MQRTILTLIIILALASKGFTQNWKQVYDNNDITIETKVIECNPTNKAYPFSYIIVRYTNKTQEELTFDINMVLEYNNEVYNETNSDHPNTNKTIHLNPSEVKEGNCNSTNGLLKIFHSNSHPDVKNTLTNLEIKAIKTK